MLIDCLIELVPSSARSTSSSATPLPPQFVPLLADTFEKTKEVIGKVLPVSKKLTALEEAEWEEDSEAGALEREMMNQCQSFSSLKSFFEIYVFLSNGDAANIPPPHNITWTGRHGPKLRWTCCVASFGGLPCSEP